VATKTGSRCKIPLVFTEALALLWACNVGERVAAQISYPQILLFRTLASQQVTMPSSTGPGTYIFYVISSTAEADAAF
jgi:hypothetical protein